MRVPCIAAATVALVLATTVAAPGPSSPGVHSNIAATTGSSELEQAFDLKEPEARFKGRLGAPRRPAAVRTQAGPPPAGLSPDDWSQIRRSIGKSRSRAARAAAAGEAPGPLVHEAQLFGHGDSEQVGLGRSVAVSGDTAVVGVPYDDFPAGPEAGSAYVFVRSGTTWAVQRKLLASDAAAGDGGTTWTEQQKLVAPDGAPDDSFGFPVSISAQSVVVGAQSDDTAGGVNAGSAHIFGSSQADLGVSKTDGQTTAVPGDTLTYTITVANAGPDAVIAAGVTDALPAALLGSTWTCSPSAGASCTANGSGNINDTVTLPVGGTATYTVIGTVAPAATGTIINTATVTPPGGLPDPNPGNNSASDVDTLTPEADLTLSKADTTDPVAPGDPLSYTLTFGNNGPSDATAVSVVDDLPADVTLVSSIPGPPTCTLAGSVLTCGFGAFPAGASGTVLVNVLVDIGASGILVNTAAVSGPEPDPDPTNNTGTAATGVGRHDGELGHGTDEVYDLAALPGPVADEDVFRIHQGPYSSYEVVVDATSGDIGAGSGPLLERLAPDGITVLQTSDPVGAGPSRSLRWRNTGFLEVEGEMIRVRSAGCTTDCGPDDIYRIRAYETTYSIPRFNNAGTQVTVLVLQNPTNYPIAGDAYFRASSGTLVAVVPVNLGPKATLVLNTATVPGASGVSGTVTVAHDGRYGDLSGKSVALEPATGFSFDSPMVPRPR